MSLWNPYAFTPTGQPVAPAAPPALRVIGGEATAQQLAMAQQAFVQFSMHSRLSSVPNPVEAGRLPDGTPYKIIDVAGARTMMVWPENGLRARPGGVVVFYKGVGFYRVWWREGKWSSEVTNRAFCGANVQRRASDGSYFCDNVATHHAAGFATKLDGLVRSNVYPFTDGVSIRREGYLLECADKGEFNFAIALAGGFAYLSLAGDSYKIMTAKPPAPAEQPTKLSKVDASGALTAEGAGTIIPEYARRVQEKFLLASLSREQAASPSSLVSRIRSLAVRGVYRALPGELSALPGKDVNFFLVDGKPPHSVALDRAPVVSGATHAAVVEASRLLTEISQTGVYVYTTEVTDTSSPEDTTIYAGFPLVARAVVGFASSHKDGYSKRVAQDSKEARWLRECVSYDGRRYSARLTTDVSLKKENNYTTHSFGHYTITGYPYGSWQRIGVEYPADDTESIRPPYFVPIGAGVLEGDSPTWSRIDTYKTLLENRIDTAFTTDEFSVPLFGVDVQITVSDDRSFKGLSSSKNIQSLQYALTGEVVVRAMLGYEEKTFVSIVSEDEYTNFAVSRPYVNLDEYTITATRTSRVCVYHRGTKIWTSPEKTATFSRWLNLYEINLPVPMEPMGEVRAAADLGGFAVAYTSRLPSGWVWTSGSTGYYTSPQVISAGVARIVGPPPILGTRVGGSTRSDDIGTAPGGGSDLFLFDYEYMASTLARPGVSFAVDPTSGGCAVISSVVNILVSPDGSVSPLADVTQLPDSSLDFWCASL